MARSGCTPASGAAGFVGLAFTHASSIAAPHGGERAFFGTNPISIAFPRADGEPVCLDMATTSIPWNRVMNARREGHPLPPDVAIDATGAATTDADAAVAVTPLGGAGYGHKGYALALMIDLLCGPLLGNPFGHHITSMFGELDTPRRIGALFVVIDPARFGGSSGGGETLALTVEQMARELAAEPGAPRMPGDPEREHERERLRDGIPIEPALLQEMRDWSARLRRRAAGLKSRVAAWPPLGRPKPVEIPSGARAERAWGRLSALRSDLAKSLLEHLGRLAARDQVLLVDDHRRHRVDAER